MEVLQKIAVLVLGLVIIGAIFYMWNGMEINGQAGGINKNTRNTINSIFSFGDSRSGAFEHDSKGGWNVN